MKALTADSTKARHACAWLPISASTGSVSQIASSKLLLMRAINISPKALMASFGA